MELDDDCRVVDVSDACDELGVPAVRTGELAPAWSGCPPLTGAIATITLRPARSVNDNPLSDIVSVLAELRGLVVVIDAGGRADQQCWGGILTACAQQFGVLGALVNGAARDVDSIARSRFPTYARGVHPARIRGRLQVAQVGADVIISDSVIRQGDVVMADSDGVVFLPSDQVSRVTALAKERAAGERAQLARLGSGEDPRDVFT